MTRASQPQSRRQFLAGAVAAGAAAGLPVSPSSYRQSDRSPPVLVHGAWTTYRPLALNWSTTHTRPFAKKSTSGRRPLRKRRSMPAYARCRGDHRWKTIEMACGHDIML